MIDQIDVSIRLRPIRFAFLVRPTDSIKLQRIFEVNTCLWGGMYNPIIPYFKKVPNWWDRNSKNFYSARKIIDYHLDFFEPDFVVESEKGMAECLEIGKDVTLHLDDILMPPSDRWSREAFGLNVFELYKYLYQKEFRFVQRHQHRIINVIPKNKTFRKFCSCIFGSFPNQGHLSYIEKGFRNAFAPEDILLNPEQLSSLYGSHFISAFKIGCEKIEVHHSDLPFPTLFLLNISDSRDLIDFWNLRVIEKNVLAIPIQWVAQLSHFCKNFILRNHRPLPDNPHGVMIHTIIQMPRSISNEEGQKIYDKYLKIKQKDAVVIRYWYPSFWRAPSDSVWSHLRPTLTSSIKRDKSEITGAKNSISFATLHPDFVQDYSNHYRWVNVVELENKIFNNDIATVFPNNFRDPSFPHFSRSKNILTTTEGFVLFPQYREFREYWQLFNGTTAFIKWFERKNIKAEISPSGKIALQVVKTLGGLNNLAAIAHPKIIRLLNKMAHKQIMIPTNDGGNQPKYYHGTTVQFSDLKKSLHEINESDLLRNFSIDGLISGNVIRLGLEVKCINCEQWNWYSIDETNYDLKCENCLNNFAFPSHQPSNRRVRWAYRVIGPFINPDYAGGAYSVALSVRFFTLLLGFHQGQFTWSTSLNLSFKTGEISEVDFILWYQRERPFYCNHKPVLVFGESKSFGKDSFNIHDIKRLKSIAKKFSGSVFVFSTMKENLSKKEQKLIRSFALWGREYNDFEESRAPVIVLTAAELFVHHDISIEWEQIGGKHASLIESELSIENLRVLSNLTQQLYLDLPSFEKWLEDRLKKKAKKEKEKQQIVIDSH